MGLNLNATVQGITAMVNSGAVSADRLDGLVDAAVTQFLRGARPSA
ncbi:hypothetical protein ACFV46_12250 [Streptomyces sp. NPDC059852]